VKYLAIATNLTPSITSWLNRATFAGASWLNLDETYKERYAQNTEHPEDVTADITWRWLSFRQTVLFTTNRDLVRFAFEYNFAILFLSENDSELRDFDLDINTNHRRVQMPASQLDNLIAIDVTKIEFDVIWGTRRFCLSGFRSSTRFYEKEDLPIELSMFDHGVKEAHARGVDLFVYFPDFEYSDWPSVDWFTSYSQSSIYKRYSWRVHFVKYTDRGPYILNNDFLMDESDDEEPDVIMPIPVDEERLGVPRVTRNDILSGAHDIRKQPIVVMRYNWEEGDPEIMIGFVHMEGYDVLAIPLMVGMSDIDGSIDFDYIIDFRPHSEYDIGNWIAANWSYYNFRENFYHAFNTFRDIIYRKDYYPPNSDYREPVCVCLSAFSRRNPYDEELPLLQGLAREWKGGVVTIGRLNTTAYNYEFHSFWNLYTVFRTLSLEAIFTSGYHFMLPSHFVSQFGGDGGRSCDIFLYDLLTHPKYSDLLILSTCRGMIDLCKYQHVNTSTTCFVKQISYMARTYATDALGKEFSPEDMSRLRSDVVADFGTPVYAYPYKLNGYISTWPSSWGLRPVLSSSYKNGELYQPQMVSGHMFNMIVGGCFGWPICFRTLFSVWEQYFSMLQAARPTSVFSYYLRRGQLHEVRRFALIENFHSVSEAMLAVSASEIYVRSVTDDVTVLARLVWICSATRAAMVRISNRYPAFREISYDAVAALSKAPEQHTVLAHVKA